jgi:hypothetical protein
MVIETFYVVMAGICFTLLGLWWLVLTTQHSLWMHHPERRRLGYHLSLYFALPGAMSLISLLTPASTFFWRGAFVVMGVVGAVESVMMQLRRDNPILDSRVARMTMPVITLIYVVVVTIAIWPSLPESLGIDVEPTALEGVLLAVLLIFGINLAWFGFMKVSIESRAED